MLGQYTHYIKFNNTTTSKNKRVTDRYDWITLDDDENEVTNQAKLSDLITNHPNYFAPIYAKDDSECIIKTDFTLAELNALPATFVVYTNSEVINYKNNSTKWNKSE
jgi:hypothetical protein